MPMNPEFQLAAVQGRAKQSGLDAVDPRGAQAMALFMQMDERHKTLFILQMKAALTLQKGPNHA